MDAVHLAEKKNWSFEYFERTCPDLKIFCFKTLLDWLFVIGCYSIFLIFSLMDACNLCV